MLAVALMSGWSWDEDIDVLTEQRGVHERLTSRERMGWS